MLEVVGLADVDADEGHELKLREPLPGGGGQRQQIAQVTDLRVDQVTAQLARPFRRLARIETVGTNKSFRKMSFFLVNLIFSDSLR